MVHALKYIKILFLFLSLLFVACNRNIHDSASTVSVDSLYHKISAMRYSNLLHMDSLTDELGRLAADNNEAEAVAANAKAYSALMKMDYAKANELYNRVFETSLCEIERLVAAVGMMTIDYRVSANRRFFDNRIKALELIKRINEDFSYLTKDDKERFERAKIEFGIVSACYFANLGMQEEKSMTLDYLRANIEKIDNVPLKVYGRMIVANNNPNRKERLSALMLGLNIANNNNLSWLQANYKLLLAISLRDSVQRRLLVNELPEKFKMFSLRNLPLDEIPLALSYEAEKDFKKSGDYYMMIEAIVVAASCKIQTAEYAEAIVLLDKALNEVNDYYRRYYPLNEVQGSSSLFCLDDSVDFVTDADAGVYNIPECLLSVRREASSAFAGMSDKLASDINREAYLELLRTTRMNKQFESRAYAAQMAVTHLELWIIVLAVALLAISLFVWLSYRSRMRYERTFLVDRKRLLEVSRRLISSLPHEATSKEMLCASVKETLDALLWNFSGRTSFEIVGETDESCGENLYLFDICYMNIPSYDKLKVSTSIPLTAEKHTLLAMVVPYVAVVIEEGLRITGISEEQERAEEQHKAYAIYLAEHKRENLQKRVSLSVVGAMRPYIDRLLKELSTFGLSLASEDEERKLKYIDELTDRLNYLNIILERWIKMRHGEFSLHVENFEVAELFDIIEKSRMLLESRGISLNIVDSKGVVKADKALTLFMINTLVDNAVKFTPAGGEITVGTVLQGDAVEIFVSDTGIGISQADIDRILGEKVYDASRIGEDNEKLQPKSKGGGFGLMNCKGIIDKYRKTDEVFSVCSMNITGNKGGGSRFSFRLPKGILRCIAVLLIFLPSSLLADDELFDRLDIAVDSVYMSNVNGNHEEAFVQAQIAIELLNSYYLSNVGGSDTLALLDGGAAELKWWREAVFPKELNEKIYFNILDMRNELAVASLALQRWQPYRYNNYIYSTLYRLVHEDTGIAARYERMQQSLNLRKVAIALLSLMLLVLLVYRLLSYVRFNIIEKMNENMVTDVNKRLLSVVTREERLSVQQLADGLLRELFLCMGENLRFERVAILLRDASSAQAVSEQPYSALHGRADVYMYSVLERREEYVSPDGLMRVLPLSAMHSGNPYVIGVLEVVSERPLDDNEVVALELVTAYLASVAYHAIVRVEKRYIALEEMEEQAKRMKFEENRLHVKNLVMDNCLSVIKHETIYYPSKVRELAGKAIADNSGRSVAVEDMRELMGYYSSIFGILSNCAMRELNDMSFSVTHVRLSQIFDDAVRYVARCSKRNGKEISLRYENADIVVGVDVDMVTCLFESLLDAAMRYSAPGTLVLRAIENDDVVSIELVDNRIVLSNDEVAEIFTPSERNITDTGLVGMEYLVAKEVVRLHEDYTGKYGGRMEARSDVSGTIILFTLPK